MNPSCGNRSILDTLILSGIFLAWLVVVTYTTIHHEYWRDEVRALSLAIDAPNWWQLPAFIKNEGHPALWYWLLQGLHALVGTKATLPILSIGISAIAIAVFVFKSPFSIFIKILFAFSVLPLYEYSVMARNYGISMMLLFCIAALYHHRQSYFFLLALLIAFLCNTNLSALIVSGALTAMLLWDTLIEDQVDLRGRKGIVISFGICLIMCSAIFSLITIKPDDNTLLTNAQHIRPISEYWASIKPALIHPGRALNTIFPANFNILTKIIPDLAIWLMIGGLLVRPIAAVSLYSAIVGIAFVHYFAYPLALRHHGIILCYVIALYWIVLNNPKEKISIFQKYFHKLALLFVIPVVLLWNDGKAYTLIKNDYTKEVSASKSLGLWLNTNAEYRNAILIVEPDYIFEAVPYYSNIQIFIPREGKFRQYGKSTKDQKQILTLDNLIEDALRLHSIYHKPIILALDLSPSQLEVENIKDLPYGRKFVCSKEGLIKLRGNTDYIGAFNNAISDENYYLYLLK